MDMNAAYREVGSYRAAAKLCGTTAKTVRRPLLAAEGAAAADGAGRRRTTTTGRRHRGRTGREDEGLISAKRLLPTVRAAGYAGSARNFRRLVAKAKGVALGPPPGPAARRCGPRARSW